MEPDLQRLIEWAFMSMVSGGVIVGSRFLFKLSKSIDTLNQSMATIIEKMIWHSRTIETHEKRIETLEQKRGRL